MKSDPSTLIPSLAALCATLGLAGAAAAEDLVISNWDGYMAPDAVDSFNSATGNSAELVLHGTNEEIMGKLIASKGAGYDVVFVSSPFAEILHKMGLAEELDHAKLPNIANLYEAATQLPHDPGNTFSVPYAWGTTNPSCQLANYRYVANYCDGGVTEVSYYAGNPLQSRYGPATSAYGLHTP